VVVLKKITRTTIKEKNQKNDNLLDLKAEKQEISGDSWKKFSSKNRDGPGPEDGKARNIRDFLRTTLKKLWWSCRS